MADPYAQFADAPADEFAQFADAPATTAPNPQPRNNVTFSREPTNYGNPAGDNPVEQGIQGMGKFFAGMGLGAKQIWAQLTGADPSKVTNPFTGDTAAETRRLDAPLQSTWGAKVGEVAGGLPFAFLPGANTYVGASLLGGLMGATQPTVEGESRLLNTGIGGGSGLLGKYAGDKVASWLTSRATEPFMGWGPSTANQAAAASVGSSARKLDQPALDEAYTRLGGIFNQARSPNASATLGSNTLGAIDTAGSGLSRPTRTALEGNENVNELIQLAANNKPVTAQQLGQFSSKLGNDANSEMTTKMGDRVLGRSLFAVKEHVDDLVGSTISDPNLAAAYDAARPMYRNLSNLTKNPSILNSATGDVNMTAFGNLLQRVDKPGYMRGGNQSDLYNAARWGQAAGQGKGSPPFSVENLGLPWLKYHALNNPVASAAGGAVSRLGAPAAPIVPRGLEGLMFGVPPVGLPYFEK